MFLFEEFLDAREVSAKNVMFANVAIFPEGSAGP